MGRLQHRRQLGMAASTTPRFPPTAPAGGARAIRWSHHGFPVGDRCRAFRLATIPATPPSTSATPRFAPASPFACAAARTAARRFVLKQQAVHRFAIQRRQPTVPSTQPAKAWGLDGYLLHARFSVAQAVMGGPNAGGAQRPCQVNPRHPKSLNGLRTRELLQSNPLQSIRVREIRNVPCLNDVPFSC
jgi:hypothetical protein